MLFDLRARGRRRAIKVIYLFLAILMGGGLVFFGIGGNTSGGLFDAFKGNGGGSNGDDRLTKQGERYQKRGPTPPPDAPAGGGPPPAPNQGGGRGAHTHPKTRPL